MYLINVNWKIAFTIIAASFQFVYPEKNELYQQMEINKFCKFSDFGYRPNGTKMVVTKIKPQTIVNENALLENIGGKAKNFLEIGEKVVENAGSVSEILVKLPKAAAELQKQLKKSVGAALQTIAKTAPKLARSLGIFGAVFGVVLDQYATSVDDVIEATNTAFAHLTEDVNERMDQMKAYVDSKILAFERETITCELTILNKFWLNCASEMTTEQSNECQRGASRVIRSSLCKFMLFETQFQKSKKPGANDLTGEQIRRLEMSLHSFRVYVTLSITVTETLVQSYEDVLKKAEESLKENKTSEETVKAMRKKYLTFLTEEVSDITKYIDYAEWSIKQIIKVHLNNGINYCKETYQCKKIKVVRADKFVLVGKKPWVGVLYQCSCMFDKTFYEAEKCVMKILYDSQSSTVWDTSGRNSKKYKLRPITVTEKGKYQQTGYAQHFYNQIMSEKNKTSAFYGYIHNLKKSMDNYWGGFLKTSIEQWKVNLEVITATRFQFLDDNKSDKDLLEKVLTPPTKLKNNSIKEQLKVKQEEETKK